MIDYILLGIFTMLFLWIIVIITVVYKFNRIGYVINKTVTTIKFIAGDDIIRSVKLLYVLHFPIPSVTSIINDLTEEEFNNIGVGSFVDLRRRYNKKSGV
jgi:hypothetical protein